MVQSGQVTVVESRLLDLTVDELIDELEHTLHSTGARRLVIDSLSEFGLYMAPEFHADLRLSVFRMLSVVAKHGVTALVTIGLDDVFTELRFSQANISYLTDAVVALRYAEVEGRLHKFMSVIKVRGSDHSRDVRGYEITDSGIEVDELPTSVGGTLTGGSVLRAPGR